MAGQKATWSYSGSWVAYQEPWLIDYTNSLTPMLLADTNKHFVLQAIPK